MSRRNLSGLRILVTGASSGIGRELALQLVQRGAKVLATARREERLNELLQQAKSKSPSVQGCLNILSGDVTLPSHREALIEWLFEHWGGLDVLVNNAGSGAIGRFDEANETRLRKIMEVDFYAAAELMRLSIPQLKRGVTPAILNIGSVLALRAVPRKSEYCAAKFALRGLSESLRVELARDGIDVLQVHPSTTKSEFFDVLTDTPATERSASVGSMDPAKVAQLAIRSLEAGRRETVLSTGGRWLVWAARRFPGILDRILAKYG